MPNYHLNVFLCLELFSQPVLAITPESVFEGQQFTVTCRSSNHASERISQEDVKYSIKRNEDVVTPGAFNGVYSAMAGANTNGNYTCHAQVKTITKWSQSTIFRAKGKVSPPKSGLQ